jgi:hypothetical protein
MGLQPISPNEIPASFLSADGGKKSPNLERFDAKARYALIVTIRAPGSDVDIYTPVETQVSVPVDVEA